MAQLSTAQAATYAQQAGFAGSALDTIVAIAQAESSLVTNARNVNSDGTVDRGILQINSYWWSQFTDAQCDDPGTAFRIAYSPISSNGIDFTPWSTYQSGAYKRYLPTTSTATLKTSTWNAAHSAAVWPWLLPLSTPHITQSFGENGESGIDLGMATGTSITSLTAGTVLSADYYGGGGVVAVASSLASIGTASVYYQHLDTIAVTVGQAVRVGDLIGTSGGQLTGGHHPSSDQFSTGPHIEVGINAPYGALWHPLGSSIDPMPWLQDLVNNGPPTADALASTGLGGVSSAVQSASAGYNAAQLTFSLAEQAMDDALAFKSFAPGDQPWQLFMPSINVLGQQIGPSDGQRKAAQGEIGSVVFHNIAAVFGRGLLVMFGLVIIIAFLFHLAQVSGVADEAKDGAERAATLAVLA